MIFLTRPGGNYPLNDDWSYGQSVYSLVTQGHIQIIPWIATTSLVQILWGALFCLPFGFSFVALRVSSLVLGLVGILATYSLLREINVKTEIAFLGALVVAINPVYFLLANTFMTDVPFFACTVLAFLFLVRAIRRNNKPDLLIGAIFACLAVLIRQFGIVIPVAFGIAYIARKGFRPGSLLAALFPTGLAVFALLMYQLAFRSQTNYGHLNFSNALVNPPEVILLSFLKFGFAAMLYLGLFVIPLLSVYIPAFWRSLSSKKRFASSIFWLGFCGFALILLITTQRSMPLLKEAGNILTPAGLGPATLRDVMILQLPHLPPLSSAIWWMINIFSIIGAGWLLQIFYFAFIRAYPLRFHGTRLFHQANPGGLSILRENWFLLFAGITFFLYLIPLSITGLYDRYLIFLLPFVLGVSAEALSPVQPSIQWKQALYLIPLILGNAVFTLGATHDYFSWNQARWEALRYLVEDLQVSPQDIDGGYEFNGWVGYNPSYRPSEQKSWWWVENDEYVISFGPIEYYETLLHVPFVRRIPPEQGSIFILHRQAGSSAPAWGLEP